MSRLEPHGQLSQTGRPFETGFALLRNTASLVSFFLLSLFSTDNATFPHRGILMMYGNVAQLGSAGQPLPGPLHC